MGVEAQEDSIVNHVDRLGIAMCFSVEASDVVPNGGVKRFNGFGFFFRLDEPIPGQDITVGRILIGAELTDTIGLQANPEAL
jgi:hypothetical protein